MICFKITDNKRLNIEPLEIHYSSDRRAFVTYEIEYYPLGDEFCFMGTIDLQGGDWAEGVSAYTYVREHGYYPCDEEGVPEEKIGIYYSDLRDDLDQIEEKLNMIEEHIIDRFLPLLPGFYINQKDSVSEKISIHVSVSLPEIKAGEIFDDEFRKNNGIFDIDD